MEKHRKAGYSAQNEYALIDIFTCQLKDANYQLRTHSLENSVLWGGMERHSSEGLEELGS